MPLDLIQDNNQFADIFGPMAPSYGNRPQSGFAFQEESTEEDILGYKIQDKPADDQSAGADDTKDKQDTAPKEGDSETDILGTGEEKEGEEPKEGDEPKAGRKPKYDFSDTSGYFADRFKSGKLIPLIDQDDKPLELKTPEDFDMVIEQNINYQVEQKTKELEQNWYKSKPPAFQAVAQYAELVDDITEIIPFIQGVRNIQSVASVDENTIEGAEAIIRYYKQATGTPEDVITDEIESLKTADKLISNAVKLKPAILQQETQRLQQMKAQKEAEEQKYWKMVTDYERSARSVISQPLFGAKMKTEEQSEIYDMIAVPNEEEGGYSIYSEIDKLYEDKNFEMLRKVALLLKKEEAFLKYASQKALSESSREIQGKIRLATIPKGNSGLEDPEQSAPKIKVNPQQKGFGKGWRG
jgi:hypothetical protein